ESRPCEGSVRASPRRWTLCCCCREFTRPQRLQPGARM
ncbi:MAG: hypothetical protein AVDCRST_MAG68-3122, partial [uncultured Gemmatimonadetes bacterium]